MVLSSKSFALLTSSKQSKCALQEKMHPWLWHDQSLEEVFASKADDSVPRWVALLTSCLARRQCSFAPNLGHKPAWIRLFNQWSWSISEAQQDEGDDVHQRLGETNTSETREAKKEDHPGTKLNFPARLPTSMSTSSEFHSQVRDGLAWFHWSIEHQSISGAKLRRIMKKIGQNQLAFSISQLKPLLALHLIPIRQLVLLRLHGEYSSWSGLRT